MNIEFKLYKPQYYDAIKANLIDSGQFDELWDSKDNINGMDHIVMAMLDNSVIGSVCIMKYGGVTAQLFRLNVRKEFRSKGIGTRLLIQAKYMAKLLGYKEIALLCKSDSQEYYEKRGFVRFGEYTWMEKKV